MCFSAGASFGAAAVLAGAGAITLKQTTSRSEWAFAGIPLIFSVQQFSEGVLWLALSDPAYANFQQPATSVFYFFAQAFWPVYIPFSVWLLEKKAVRKKYLQIFIGAGILLATYMIFGMVRNGMEATIEGCHIKYGPKYPFGIPRTILYVLTVGIPLFISGYKRMAAFGIAVFVSLAVTVLFFKAFLASVWCFFAAVVSVLIWWVIRESKGEKSFPL